MNKTEAAYALLLEELVRSGEVKMFWFQGLRLRLAPNTHYTPDFMVLMHDGEVRLVEVKGSWKAPHQEDSRVKLKVAAQIFPQFTFVAAVSMPAKKGGGFEMETFRSDRHP